ncbi:MAG: hypothetical protein C0591_14260 [Marinilabiliales bacterium]|nr:MAG: hypothetical protein C0591_14260 [Marinilabiliales bacterium]
MSIGQFNRSDSGLKTNVTKPYEWKANMDESLLFNSLEENFDGFSDFTLNFSPWTTADLDGSATYGITDHTFPNSGAAMAYIVFNPSNVEPSMGADAAIQPHSGSKFAACFAATTPPNNDWIITPLINLGTNSNLSFWVKSYTAQYGLERYKVGVSNTNNDPSSFTIISGSNYLKLLPMPGNKNNLIFQPTMARMFISAYSAFQMTPLFLCWMMWQLRQKVLLKIHCLVR